MGRLLLLILLAGGGYYLYAAEQESSAAYQTSCNNPDNANSHDCLKEKHGDDAYVVSRATFNNEIRPKMNEILQSMPASGTYPIYTSAGDQIMVQVTETITPGKYCPIKKRRLNSYSYKIDPVKPLKFSEN